MFKDVDGKRERVGSFYLIYNNGSEGDPMVVISDYGWRDDETEEAFERILGQLSANYGG